jgi:hypothetical protein
MVTIKTHIMTWLLFLCTLLPLFSYSQQPNAPLKKNDYQKVTSHSELTNFIQELDAQSDLLNVEKIGQSVEGRNLYALKFSSTEFGKDPSKIKVLVFAQQHGNEQSGKEGALLLAQELIKPENKYLFDKIDFALIPQVNPDGSEANKRRNANNMDLNRNHLILTEPETMALHAFFDKYLFEVTMDVHEYSPYGEEWRNYGYRKNSDITVGATTNLNVSKEIRKLSNENYLPYILKYLGDRSFSSFEYCPGGPPDINYMRHSTFDFNDGRQSFGIQNTFSFIQEGMNGKDDYIENLQHRAEGQMAGILGLLEYVFHNKDKIKRVVAEERDKLVSEASGKEISVQSEHVSNGEKLQIPLFSYFSGNDSVVTVTDYRPVVKSIYEVIKPAGYLIPANWAPLFQWADNQSLKPVPFINTGEYNIEQYMINRIDSIDFEGDIVANPDVATRLFPITLTDHDYYLISTSQLKGNMILMALEPKSMLGLATYKQFAHLLKGWEAFPILRVMKK